MLFLVFLIFLLMIFYFVFFNVFMKFLFVGFFFKICCNVRCLCENIGFFCFVCFVVVIEFICDISGGVVLLFVFICCGE